MSVNIQLNQFNKPRGSALLAVMLSISLAGCHSNGPYEPQIKHIDLESTDVFVVLDKGISKSVTCTGIQEAVDDTGRLQLVAKINNLLERPLRVEVDCVFKDAKGFPTGEVVPFRAVYLPPNGQEQARFVSRDNTARRFTIRARVARD